MSDNAVKGIGAAALLGLLSLRACKACDNTADDALKNSDSFFSCNKASKSATDFDPPKTDPSEVSVPSQTEVYQPLSPSQVDQTLNNETSNADESIVVLKKDANNSFTISDNLSQTFKSLNDIDIDNSKVLIVDGDLTTSEIKALNKKGIKFICNKDVYEQQKNIANYEVILIYSEDREILKDLYSINDEQVNDIMEYARPVIADYNIKKIGYESDL